MQGVGSGIARHGKAHRPQLPKYWLRLYGWVQVTALDMPGSSRM